MKAMASDVNQRYVSADAMLMDLEEFRKNPSINFDYTPADLLIADGDRAYSDSGRQHTPYRAFPAGPCQPGRVGGALCPSHTEAPQKPCGSP